MASPRAKGSRTMKVAGWRESLRERLRLSWRERYGRRNFWKETLHAYIYLLPALVILGAFTFYPFFRAFWISAHRYYPDLLHPDYVGWENYLTIFRDELFWRSLWHTVAYVLGSVIPQLALGLFIALLLNARIRAKSFFRTAYFLPYVTPSIAASMVFLWIYDRDYGLLNYILHKLFHISFIDWLNNPSFALPAVIILGIWKYTGFSVVIYLAGLQGIDRTYYEAAEVDGASAWARFRYITLPLLSPTTFFLFIVSVIGAFKVFNEIYVLWPGATGGPLNAAMTIMIYFYHKAFGEWHLGEGAAVANILFVIIFIITLIQMRLSRRWVFYQ
ncbi:MAG TPA: sugar ABC transporter permease [Candidatus Acetothermia bacterium]|nr:sugar ABC transporter permease [Candidatus Acetothermia bacterium]